MKSILLNIIFVLIFFTVAVDVTIFSRSSPDENQKIEEYYVTIQYHVKRDEIGSGCGTNEIYSSCTNGLCRPQNCSQRGLSLPCPILAEGSCQKGCVCLSGYLRSQNGSCVPESNCDSIQNSRNIVVSPFFICGPNKVLSNCLNGICGPVNCSQLGRPIACPLLAEGTCVTGCACREGYLRTENGNCVQQNQCDTCGGDPNAVSGCGINCGRLCSNYDKGPVACPDICKLNGCDCKPGYVYDEVILKCVLPQQCTNPCMGPNEVYQTQPPSCTQESCIDYAGNATCSSTSVGTQVGPRCWCKANYYRNYNGSCIDKSQCDSEVCPEGESLSKCPAISCDADYCPLSRNYAQDCPQPRECGRPRCVCSFNRSRDRRTGKCIPIYECPPFECNGSNEEYEQCPLPCSNQNCSDFLNITSCQVIGSIGIVVSCRPKCLCKKGYYRNTYGTCINSSQCIIPSYNLFAVRSTNAANENNAEVRFAQGNMDFTSNVLYEVTEGNSESVILSPFSVLSLLAQLTLYATGKSYNQLINALNLANNDEVRQVFPIIIDSITSQRNVTSDLAQKVYVNIQYELSDSFKNDTKNVFEAEAENIDFSKSSEAAQIINAWVEENTNNRITDLISPDMINQQTRLVLVNAIYFKGLWKIKFNPSDTEKKYFYLNSSKTVRTDIMSVEGSFRYAESSVLDAQIIELDYIGGNYSFIAILPNSIDGLSDLLLKLRTKDTLNNELNNMFVQKVQVYLPKYESQTTTNLNEILQNLNITYIFDPSNSGLNNILKEDQDNQNLYVSFFIQKAFILVDEMGSEAAAATATGVSTTAAIFPPTEEYIFNANHPFIYYIILKSGQSYPLFCGVYAGP